MSLLEGITGPRDLDKLSSEQLVELLESGPEHPAAVDGERGRCPGFYSLVGG